MWITLHATVAFFFLSNQPFKVCEITSWTEIAWSIVGEMYVEGGEGMVVGPIIWRVSKRQCRRDGDKHRWGN